MAAAVVVLVVVSAFVVMVVKFILCGREWEKWKPAGPVLTVGRARVSVVQIPFGQGPSGKYHGGKIQAFNEIEPVDVFLDVLSNQHYKHEQV
jgi:hypothetical protein